MWMKAFLMTLEGSRQRGTLDLLPDESLLQGCSDGGLRALLMACLLHQAAECRWPPA